MNVRARSGGAGGKSSLIRNSFARNSGSGLRARLLGRDFVMRDTGGDQKCDCQKQNSGNCQSLHHEGKANHEFRYLSNRFNCVSWGIGELGCRRLMWLRSVGKLHRGGHRKNRHQIFAV